MNARLGAKLRLAAVVLVGAVSGMGAAQAALILDDFSSPAPPVTGSGTGTFFFDQSFGTFAGVPSQVRESLYDLFSDPASSGAAVALGGGNAALVTGKDALGQFIFSYGAFTRPGGVGGPALGLNLTGLDTFRAEFGLVDQPLNLNVVLYTSAPQFLADGITPLYYLQSGINIGPASPGGPLVADLFLDGRNTIAAPFAPYFNFAQVDGVVFLIDRSGSSRGNRYALDTLLFVQTVPEPAEYVMLVAGLALLSVTVYRRRRGG